MCMSFDLGVEFLHGLGFSLHQQEREGAITAIMMNKDGKMSDILPRAFQNGQVTSTDVFLEFSELDWIINRSFLMGFL